MKLKNLIFSILGTFVIFMFVFPITQNCTPNIGTATGIIIGIVVTLYGLFMQRINRYIATLWKKKVGKIILSFLMICCVLIVGLAGVETYFIVSAACDKPAENTTVIILGCRVYGDRPSRILKDRMDVAIEYLNANPAAYVIVSGGKGSDEDISEAQCMHNYLMDKGINKERIIVEDKSTSTKENFKFSKKLMEEYGLAMELTVATSDFHEYRAGMDGEELGIEISAIPAKTRWFLLPTYYVRELYGVLYEWVR